MKWLNLQVQIGIWRKTIIIMAIFLCQKKNLWNDSDSTSRSAYCDLAKKMCDQEILFWFFNACHCFCQKTKCSCRWCYKFIAFNMGLLLKVQTFWEAHKNLRNLPHALYIDLVNVQTMKKIFSNFVCFSESPNFTITKQFWKKSYEIRYVWMIHYFLFLDFCYINSNGNFYLLPILPC